ncbi:MAG: DM13 domain-containing protein [Nostocaceae cyanobacterium]|nr:DM13 domain-containing protein [Nostocaceae cyanobacterium]
MKFQSLLVLSIATLLTVGCAKEGISKETQTPPQTATTPTNLVASSISQSGQFRDGEHPTRGMVKIITENGQRYLEFDSNFKTDSGPDLFVILHNSQTVPTYNIKEKDYLSIARLKKTSGTQRYAIPNNVDLTKFSSVAVWCRKFNATFGYAPLQV